MFKLDWQSKSLILQRKTMKERYEYEEGNNIEMRGWLSVKSKNAVYKKIYYCFTALLDKIYKLTFYIYL